MPIESGAKIMALTDATPTNSPLGIAIASGAVLTVLLEALVKEGVLTGNQVRGVVTTAQSDIRNYRHRGPALDDAGFVLDTLLKQLFTLQ
jgi:hypothetical protein